VRIIVVSMSFEMAPIKIYQRKVEGSWKATAHVKSSNLVGTMKLFHQPPAK
jgi:hypothetical protein